MGKVIDEKREIVRPREQLRRSSVSVQKTVRKLQELVRVKGSKWRGCVESGIGDAGYSSCAQTQAETSSMMLTLFVSWRNGGSQRQIPIIRERC